MSLMTCEQSEKLSQAIQKLRRGELWVPRDEEISLEPLPEQVTGMEPDEACEQLANYSPLFTAEQIAEICHPRRSESVSELAERLHCGKSTIRGIRERYRRLKGDFSGKTKLNRRDREDSFALLLPRLRGVGEPP